MFTDLFLCKPYFTKKEATAHALANYIMRDKNKEKINFLIISKKAFKILKLCYTNRTNVRKE